jgi:hydrogenase expression/formation protein HypC
MCLAIPMRIARIDGPVAEVEVEGVKRRARLDLLPNAGVGDYVLIHAGMAIALVDEDEAQQTLALIKEFVGEI